MNRYQNFQEIRTSKRLWSAQSVVCDTRWEIHSRRGL